MYLDNHRILKTVVICVIAVAMNVLTMYIFYNWMKIPLFFDTIWTVAVVFYSGLVPGLCVSLAYNAINALIWTMQQGFFDPFIMLYAVCGVLIVFSTWIFARRKEEFQISVPVTILYLFLIALLSSFCTIVAGGIIDFFHYKYYEIPDMMNPIKKFTESFVHQQFSLLASCILGQIPISFLDRLLATFSGFGIYSLARKFLKEN
ncbi:MAG: hypothetical protein II114_02890 [Treponema sp.]|nr:hypothetical protein [Treponema sp.]MBQ2530591.1 hypothetical protein [Treponema sp.]MBQ4235470.1 hypothetical protein [Treponema sp.]